MAHLFCNQTAQMSAASAQLPSTLGSYSTCRSIHGAMYCVGVLTSADPRSSAGFCVPQTCAEDAIRKRMLDLYKLTTASINVYCTSSEAAHMSTLSIVLVSVFSVYLLFVAVVSLMHYHGYFEHHPAQQDTPGSSHMGPHSDDDDDRLPTRRVVTSTVRERLLALRPTKSTASSIARNFSVVKSWRQLCYHNKDSFANVFNACRVVCVVVLVITNTFLYTNILPGYANADYLRHVEGSPAFSLLAAGSFAIATFLFISGFTMTMIIRQIIAERDADRHVTLSRSGWVWLYCRFIVQRWLRLVPLYVTVLLVTQTLLPLAGHGPFWRDFATSPFLTSNCKKYFYSNLLFINNVFPTDSQDRCLPWTYYFALDFQFMLVAPPAVLLLTRMNVKRRRQSVMLVGFLVVLGVIGVALQAAFGMSDEFSLDWLSTNASTVPWDHTNPYLIGAFMAFVFIEVSERADEYSFYLYAGPQVQMSLLNAENLTSSIFTQLRRKGVRIAMIWCSVAALVLSAVLQWVALRWSSNTALRVSLICFTSVLWPAAISTLILPMFFGYGGALRRFLCHRVWSPMSRLVYAAYLVHVVLILLHNAQLVHLPRFTATDLFYETSGHVLLTAVVSFIMHITVEAPMINALT